MIEIKLIDGTNLKVEATIYKMDFLNVVIDGKKMVIPYTSIIWIKDL